jgi:lipopolysaccharide/colanic/teichoic acid biosynthesis glycosyltransferase
MATLKLNPSAAAPAPAAPAPVPPAWCQPQRLRQWGLRRGWRCQLRPAERWRKRALDLVLCVLLGVPAAVVVGLAALAVRWDSPGKALFAQTRVGRNGRPFRMWKLRTMVANAQAMEAELRHLSELPWPDFKITRDPRVTRVGGWLRRTSLDELPQIWNIVRGEMSWVGPRPTSFGLERYQLWHTERLATPPGLTGLWQIVARAECDFDQRLRLDLAYGRNWRLRLDLAILAATVGAVWRQRGAK